MAEEEKNLLKKEESKVKSRKPSENAFTQQKMLAWQPVLSPPWVVSIFLIIFIVFTPIGVFIVLATNNVSEYVIPYTSSCQMTYQNNSLGQPDYTLGQQCIVNVTFKVTQRMDPPIYMYYSLTNFYPKSSSLFYF